MDRDGIWGRYQMNRHRVGAVLGFQGEPLPDQQRDGVEGEGQRRRCIFEQLELEVWLQEPSKSVIGHEVLRFPQKGLSAWFRRPRPASESPA